MHRPVPFFVVIVVAVTFYSQVNTRLKLLVLVNV